MITDLEAKQLAALVVMFGVNVYGEENCGASPELIAAARRLADELPEDGPSIEELLNKVLL